MEILSLEHLRSVSKTEAIAELIKFNGIGVKTAACVSLFCLRKECFAVDTHVHRFCRWLRWVPDRATAEQTFNHCELHVPDHLKYGLHQLFIIHGKSCYRCKASTKAGSKDWVQCACPLEDLLDRGSGKMRLEKNQQSIDAFFREEGAAKGGDADEEKESQSIQQGVDVAAEAVLKPTPETGWGPEVVPVGVKLGNTDEAERESDSSSLSELSSGDFEE